MPSFPTLTTLLLRISFLLVILLGYGSTAIAGGLIGGEINYNCVGGNNYEITLQLYRDCAGVSGVINNFIFLFDTCGNQSNIPMPLSSTTEISDLCPNQIQNSACNTGLLPGVERLIYKDTVSLAGCGSWTISYSCFCRAGTNITNGSSSFYLHAKVNTGVGGCNQSPIFHDQQPIPSIELMSHPTNVSFVAYDSDGDLLKYSWTAPMQSTTQPVTYNVVFFNWPSYGIPGQDLDTNTGILDINYLSSLTGNLYYGVKVEEFDSNGNLKGYVIKDYRFNYLNGANPVPSLDSPVSNVSGGLAVGNQNIIQSWAGANLCFDLQFSDQDSLDTLDVYTDLGRIYPGASVTISGTNPVVATICATIPVTATTAHDFTITATDDVCPIYGKRNVWASIELMGPVSVSPNDAICPGDSAQLYALGDTSYQWTVLSGDPILLGVNFGCDTCNSTWAKPSVTTTYVVSGLTSGTSDTVVVAPVVNPTVATGNDTSMCANGACIQVSVSGASSYVWSTGFTSSFGTGYICSPGTYTVTGTDTNGCSDVDTIVVSAIVSPTPPIASNDTTVCAGSCIILQATGTNTYQWSNGTMGDSNTVCNAGTYIVTGTDTNGCTANDTVIVTNFPTIPLTVSNDTAVCAGTCIALSASGANNYLWSTGSTNANITVCSPGIYGVTSTDTNGCSVADSVVVTHFIAPVVQLNNDTTVCTGSCVSLTASGATTYLWSNLAVGNSITVCSPGSYFVVGTDTNGCSGTDTVSLFNFPAPTLSVSNDTSICNGDSVTLVANGVGSFSWSNGSTGTNITVSTTGIYSVTLTDANGCTAVDSVQVVVNALPVVMAGPDTTICLGNTLTVTASGASNYSWNNGSNMASTTYSAGGWATVTGTDTNGCSATDSLLITVDSSQIVAGFVSDTNGNALTNTKVFLIKHFTVQDSVVALDSTTTDGSGFYAFHTAEPVVYVKSAPDSGVYPMQLPTYHDSGAVFLQADSIITLLCDTVWADIRNLSGMNPGGPGFLAGYVFQGAGKSSVCEGAPVVGLSLLLLNEDQQIIAQTFTDDDGNYRFNNLIPGTYILWADDPNINLSQAPTLVFAGGNNGLSANLHYYENNLELCGTVGIASIASGLENLHCFPNPSTGEVTLELDLLQVGPVSINVLDALGATVWQRQLSGNGKQVRETLDLSGLSTGVYFLQVTTGTQGTTQKLILR
ncbi:MAG: T9SS type A sorting domain-containing protein [Salibacteraceae bacterium]